MTILVARARLVGGLNDFPPVEVVHARALAGRCPSSAGGGVGEGVVWVRIGEAVRCSACAGLPLVAKVSALLLVLASDGRMGAYPCPSGRGWHAQFRRDGGCHVRR